MPHIHTEPGQHDLTASAFIIRTDGDEPRAMVHMHKKLAKYMQFGGHVELNETPWQTMSHEVKEEAGYDFQQLTLLQPKDRIQQQKDAILHPSPACMNTHAFPGNHHHTDIGYAFVTNQEPSNAPDEGESLDIILITKAELLAMPSDTMSPNVRDTFLYVMDTCLNSWEKVSVDSYEY
jgi:8-oxo-dGTP pyrophosphatase MutT (NUDIX family)